MKITNLEQDFMQLSVTTGKTMGLDGLGSKIFAILYLEPEPITMESISERTGYGLTSIFNKLNMMNQFNFVQKIKKPGSKKAYFFIRKDLSQMFKERLILGYKNRVIPLKKQIPTLLNKYKNSKLTKSDKERLIILKDYNQQLIKMEKGIKEFISIIEKI